MFGSRNQSHEEKMCILLRLLIQYLLPYPFHPPSSQLCVSCDVLVFSYINQLIDALFVNSITPTAFLFHFLYECSCFLCNALFTWKTWNQGRPFLVLFSSFYICVCSLALPRIFSCPFLLLASVFFFFVIVFGSLVRVLVVLFSDLLRLLLYIFFSRPLLFFSSKRFRSFFYPWVRLLCGHGWVRR